MLFREAIALGLLERDGGVQTRLIQKMLFLEGEVDPRQAPALLARAIDLRLHEGDVVVRRILVQKMRLIGAQLREEQRVSPAEIEAAYAAQHPSLRTPDRVDLVHVFLSRDLHGEDLTSASEAARVRLLEEDPPLGAASALGQPFPLGHILDQQSSADLDRHFGPGFGQAVFGLEEQRWSRPIASAYGHHLVRVTAREPGRPPPLASVTDRLRLEIEADRRAANLDTLLGALKARYHVRVVAGEAPLNTAPTRSQEAG
jgi:hypothetical protein